MRGILIGPEGKARIKINISGGRFKIFIFIVDKHDDLTL